MILLLYDQHFEQLKQRGSLLNYLINVKNVYKLSKKNIGQLDNYINKYDIKIIIQFCIHVLDYNNIGRNHDTIYALISDT